MKTSHLFLFSLFAFAIVAGLVQAAPLVTNVSASATYSSITVDWNTNGSYNSTLWYGVTSPPSSSAVGTNGTSPSVTVSSLLESTTYYYTAQTCLNTDCTNSSIGTIKTDCNPSTGICSVHSTMPELGTSLSDLLVNLLPGVIGLLVALLIVAAVGGLLYAIVAVIKRAINRDNK